MATVLKADNVVPFGELEHRLLADGGLDLVERHCPTEDDLIEHGQAADALLVVAEPVTARVIGSLGSCRVIGRFGSGLENVDTEAATRQGIQVTYMPTASTEEVSDHAIAMLLSLARRLPALDAAVRRGEWAIPVDLPAFRRLSEQTLGIVGVGRIGAMVARKARAFGLKIVAYDPYASSDALDELGIEPLGLDQLLARSDHVSLHAPLTPETRHLIGRPELSLMKTTANLINVARGGLVCQAALVSALQSGGIAAAAVDVLEQEPPEPDDPLLTAPNLLLSPHAAHFSEESMNELRRAVIEDVAAVLGGRAPRNPANEVVGA